MSDRPAKGELAERENPTAPLHTPTLARLFAQARAAEWFWRAIFLPFLYTRLAWILAALFAAGNFLPNPSYAEYAQQGGFLSRYFLIDLFARWDSKWYLSIARDGYALAGDSGQSYSNLAFFPLYPMLTRGIGWLGLRLPDSFILLGGILLSNLCLLAACALLYKLATRNFALREDAVRRALLLFFAFPANFFLSSFYPESLFLFLAAAGFYFALRSPGNWGMAGLCAGLAALTRPQGILVAAALGWFYLESHGWQLKRVRADVLWLGLAPLALLGHFTYMHFALGNFFAPLQAQAAWGRGQYGFFEGLWLNLNGPTLDVFKIDALLLLVFLACGATLFWKGFPPTGARALGLFTLLLCLMPLSTGLLVSVSRFLSVVFPVFFLLGQQLERKEAFQLVLVTSFTLQVIYFAGWVNYYWIG